MRRCWEIREDGPTPEGNGSAVAWLHSCASCLTPAGGLSCWEQRNGSPSCCAPLYITCDFCEIYIEHRREIAGLSKAPAGIEPDDRAFVSPPDGGKPDMEKVQFNVPALWADHHVLKVRDVLAAVPGVADIIASSAFRMVALSFDPAATSPAAIAAALASAGYPVAEDGQGVIAQPVPVAPGASDPAWSRLGFRVARTDPRDAKASR